MAYSNAIRFSLDLLESPRVQSEVQTALNECLTAIVDLARQQDCQFTVEELGAYLSESLFKAGADDDDVLSSLFANMLARAKVQDPNHQMFKTMSVGSLEGGLSPEVMAAINAAKKKQDSQ